MRVNFKDENLDSDTDSDPDTEGKHGNPGSRLIPQDPSAVLGVGIAIGIGIDLGCDCAWLCLKLTRMPVGA